MSHANDLTDGLARLIASTGLALYRDTGIYTAAETGITVMVLPDTPDRLLCLSHYVVEDTDTDTGIDAVQIRMRAGRDPREVNDWGDSLRDLLHHRRHFDLGPVRCSLAWRQSQAQMGQDAKGRAELAANYYFRTVRTGPNLID